MASDPAHGPQAARCRDSRCCVCLVYDPRALDRLGDATRVLGHHEPPIGHYSCRGRPRAELDTATIPLCEAHHVERHDVGFREFWTRYARVDWQDVRAAMRRGALWNEWQFVPF